MSKHKEFYFKEGCYIEEWLNDIDNKDMSIARVRIEPNTETKLHSLLGTIERYVILNGNGLVSINDQLTHVSEGDVVTIQAEESQKIRNEETRDLIFLAICTPRFKVENYQQL